MKVAEWTSQWFQQVLRGVAAKQQQNGHCFIDPTQPALPVLLMHSGTVSPCPWELLHWQKSPLVPGPCMAPACEFPSSPHRWNALWWPAGISSPQYSSGSDTWGKEHIQHQDKSYKISRKGGSLKINQSSKCCQIFPPLALSGHTAITKY